MALKEENGADGKNKKMIQKVLSPNCNKEDCVCAASKPKLVYLKGRKPPIAMCTAVCLYQGWGGICRAMFRVRQGAWKLPARFFPTMPPMTVRGKPTTTQAPRSRSTVVAGKAWVEPLHQWIEFTTLHVRKRGAGRMNSKVSKRKQIISKVLRSIKIK